MGLILSIYGHEEAFSTAWHYQLTLGLQLGQDGLCAADRSCGEGLDAFLGHIAHSPDMGVDLLGGGVGSVHHPTRGADERQAGNTFHHTGLRRAGDLMRSSECLLAYSHSGGAGQLGFTTPGANNCTKQEPEGSSMGLTPSDG